MSFCHCRLQNEEEKLELCSNVSCLNASQLTCPIPTFIVRKYVVVILKAKAERTSPAKRSVRLTERTPCFCATMKTAPRSIVLVEWCGMVNGLERPERRMCSRYFTTMNPLEQRVAKMTG